jgi:hypothetical protein
MLTVMIKPLKHKEKTFSKFNSLFLWSFLLWDITVTFIIIYVTVQREFVNQLFGVSLNAF